MSRRIIDLSWPIEDRHIKAVSTVENPGSFRYNGYICLSHKFDCPASVGLHFEIASHCVPDPKGPPLERLPKDDVFAADVPVERLYEIPTTFLRLNRKGLDEAVTADELEKAAAGVSINADDALLVQAQETSTRVGQTDWKYQYFSPEAVDWIVSKKVRLFGSDTGEDHRNTPHTPRHTVQLFMKLWKIGAWCLVRPNNLALIRKCRVKLTVLPLPARTTVTTCRAVVIEED